MSHTYLRSHFVIVHSPVQIRKIHQGARRASRKEWLLITSNRLSHLIADSYAIVNDDFRRITLKSSGKKDSVEISFGDIKRMRTARSSATCEKDDAFENVKLALLLNYKTFMRP